MKIIAKIISLDVKSTKLQIFDYDRFLKKEPNNDRRTPEQKVYLLFSATSTIKFSEKAVDALILGVGKMCKLQILDGVIISVEPFKSEEELIKILKGE